MTRSTNSIRGVVLDALSSAGGLPEDQLHESTPLLAVNMDSLTLVAVLTRVEAEYEVSFEAEELVEILRARDVADLITAVTRKVAAATQRESASSPDNRGLQRP